MPTTQSPQPLSEVMAGTLFDGGHLSDELRLKCKYAYAVTRAEALQDQGKEVPPDLQDTIQELGRALEAKDITPATALS